MAHRVLVAYGSTRGSTREVAEAVAATLREHGHEVDVERAGRVRELGRYEAVVLGGALYRGRWHPGARRFLKRQRRRLPTVPLAVFAMGPRRNEEAAFERSRLQLERALAKAPEIEPASTAVFGGVDRKRGIDLRDWDAIRAWTVEVGAALDGRSSARHGDARGKAGNHGS